MASYARDPRAYELMAILLPDMADEDLTGAIDRVSGYITNVTGSIKEILKDSPWGRRRLAYSIRFNSQDYRDGTYVIWHFDLEPSRMTEIERELKFDSRVIRYLVVHDDPKWGSPNDGNQPPPGDAESGERRPARDGERRPAPMGERRPPRAPAMQAEASAAAGAADTPVDATSAAATETVAATDNTVTTTDEPVVAADDTVATAETADETVGATDDAFATGDETVSAGDDAAATADETVSATDDAVATADETVSVSDEVEGEVIETEGEPEATASDAPEATVTGEMTTEVGECATGDSVDEPVVQEPVLESEETTRETESTEAKAAEKSEER